MNDDKRKCLENMYVQFPGIFKPQLKTACLYFNDRSIYTKALYIDNCNNSLAYFGSIDDKLQLYVEFDPNWGFLTMVNDLRLDDDKCVTLYEVGIDIAYVSDKEHDTISYYDKEAIMRRYRIKNIIEHE